MNKSLYSLLCVLFVATTAYAGTSCSVAREHQTCYTNTSCGDVSVGCFPYTFDVQFRALILKPSTSNSYFGAMAQGLPLPSPRWTILDLHPKYHFGFDLGFRTSFLNPCRNIGVNWERFNSSTHRLFVAPEASDMVGPFFEIGPNASPYQNVDGREHFSFNAVHVNAAQLIEIGDTQAHLFAGINFTSLKQTMTTRFANTNADFVRTIFSPISFRGAGPEIGVCLNYQTYFGLELTGKLAAAILVGHNKNNTEFVSTSTIVVPDLTYPNLQSITSENRTIVVPVFEEHIGLGYGCNFWCNYSARIEVGYEARVYFDALQSNDMGSEVSSLTTAQASTGVFARTFGRHVSNFALTGPYVAFNLSF